LRAKNGRDGNDETDDDADTLPVALPHIIANLQEVRARLLPELEAQERRLNEESSTVADVTTRRALKREIKRLRRILRIHPTPDKIREQTRSRTAAWRWRRSRARAPRILIAVGNLRQKALPGGWEGRWRRNLAG
jgi:hypothetical protein